MPFNREWQLLVVSCVGLAGALVGVQGLVHSPNLDEVGHLPAGCLATGFGRFDLYKVNPPLVKALAAIPVVISNPKYNWTEYVAAPGTRNEWAVGRKMIAANGLRSFFLFSKARWMLLSLWLIGTLIIGNWATHVGGRIAGCTATVLWCFCPSVIGWTATICPDSPAAAIGILSLWLCRTWLRDLNWSGAAIAGVGVGAALLTKTSWLILVPLYPFLAMFHHKSRTLKAGRHLVLMGLVALYVINSVSAL